MSSKQIKLNRAMRRAQKSVNRPALKQLEKARLAVERQANKHTGYAGQDYEVRCTYKGDENYVAGWTNDANGGPLAAFIEKHPSMDWPVVVKLTDADKARLTEQYPLTPVA